MPYRNTDQTVVTMDSADSSERPGDITQDTADMSNIDYHPHSYPHSHPHYHYGNGSNHDDMEEPSLHTGREYLLNENGEKQLQGTNRKTKRTLYCLLSTLLVSVGAFVAIYYLADFHDWRDTFRPFSSNEKGSDCPICEFSSEDVKALQEQIDLLEAQNSRLADQLDEYSDLNDRLNATVIELQEQNVILTENNDRYEELNGELSDSIQDLQEQNELLEEQVEIYTGLNQQLNATAQDLEDQVDRLEEQVNDLTDQNDRLEELVDSFTEETDRLQALSEVLQDNVDRLEGRISELASENDRLQTVVTDLQTVVSFLDETTDALDQTFDDVAAFLAEQINTNRMITMETLQNTYQQRLSNWDCALKDQFATESFAEDGDVAIPSNRYQEVIDYVEERVLSELCLDTNDFEQYLDDRYGGQDITINRMVSGVQRYTMTALDYYFPESGEVGLSPFDWADATYQCDNLSNNKKFSMD